MKKCLEWLKSNRSDAPLFIVFIVLLNLVSVNAFFRVDVTGSKAYSLSQTSKTLVSTLEEPLSVKVFFSANLPAPYNTAEQYLKDLLVEYKGSANSNFRYEFFDAEKPENKTMASEFGLRQIQIQQVSDTEVGLKQAYMGLALVYGDRIETVDGLTDAQGMEYRLTTAMSKMISDTSALAGLQGAVNLTLYITPEIGNFGVSGFDTIDTSVVDALTSVNADNGGRISFKRVVPKASEIASIAEKYGLPTISWDDKEGSAGEGILGLVLEHNDTFKIVPLELARSLFGYGIAGLDSLQTNLEDALKSLVAKQIDVAYLSGYGEKDINDNQNGAGNFQAISKDWYNFIGVDITKDEIPTNVKTLMINGPIQAISDEALYKIDQFVMRGGNLFICLDPMIEKQNQQYAYYGVPPTYEKNESGLEKLLTRYGVEIPQGYVMDEACYTQNDPQYGSLDYYFVPFVQQENMSQTNPITTNIPYTLFFQTGAIKNIVPKEDTDRTVEVLVKTSPKAWIQSENIMLNPMGITPPSDDAKKEENLAVLLSGRFMSAFDSIPSKEETEASNLVSDNRLSKSVQDSSIFITASSAITTPAVIDASGKSATGIFMRNALDYLNGNEDLCLMRTKSIAASTFTVENAALASFFKFINQYILSVIVALIGLFVWRLRSIRRRKIRDIYYPISLKESVDE